MRVEAKVAEPGTPQPWLVGVLRRQAHQLLHLQIEQVQSITGAFYLGEKTPLPTANPQDFTLDQHLAPALVQLPDANDARVQLQDVVYIRQPAVLAVLTLEMTVPWP